jgi:glucose-1-phosphate thymidylyltransferase
MEVLILAAGFGTRLYPITERIPKALVKVKGKPVLDYIIKKLLEVPEIEKINILSNTKFYINFIEWAKEFEKKAGKVKIKIINNGINSDLERKGAIADLKYSLQIINPEEDLLILACDSLFEFDLNKMISLRNLKNSSIVALKKLNNRELIKKYSCVIIEEDLKIKYFEEKPKNPKSDICATACYLLIEKDLKRIIDGNFYGKDNLGSIIEFLVKNSQVYGQIYENFWIDIGSKEELAEAEKILENTEK